MPQAQSGIMAETLYRALAGGLMACWGFLITLPDAVAQEPETVVIGGSEWVGDAPTRVAEAMGLFNRNRTQGAPHIAVKHAGSGLEALQRFLDGETDFALAAATPVALALTGQLEGRAQPPRSIAVLGSVALSNQSHLVIADAASGIRGIEDFSGKRIGVMFNTSSHYGWTHFVRFHGLDESSIELVDIEVGDMAAAVLDQRIDAAVIWHPWDQPLREALDDRVVEFELRALYTLNWLLLTDRDWAVRHPAVVNRVLSAYISAIDILDARRDDALELQNRNPELDLPLLRQMTDSIIWRLGMNWSVLVNLGSQFEWLESRPGLTGLRIPEPHEYLMGAPLIDLAPDLVSLPDYLLLPPKVSAGP